MEIRESKVKSWAIRSAKDSPEAWLIGLAIGLGTSLKLWLDITTVGTNDVAYWHHFTQYLMKYGTVTIYRDIPYYNHPPLVSSALLVLGNITAGAPYLFPFLFRLPAIIADVGSAVLLWKLASRCYGRGIALKGVALFALSPVLIMVSGFHGNTDPVFVFWILWGAYFLVCRGSWPAAALCIGLSLNIKIVPIIIIPAFFFWIDTWRRRMGFLLVVGAVALAGFSYHLWACFPDLWRNIFAYGGIKGIWGLGRLWMQFRETFPPSLQPWFPVVARLMMVVLITLCAFFKGKESLAKIRYPGGEKEQDRGTDLLEAVGWAFLIFLVVAPGFGVQYLSWLVGPGIFLGTVGLFLFTVIASVFLFRVYTFWSGGFPWLFANSDARGQWVGMDRTLDMILWLFLVGWASFLLASWICSRRQAQGRQKKRSLPLPSFPVEETLDGSGSKIALLVMAYHAESKIQETLARIPRALLDQITGIFLILDGNNDPAFQPPRSFKTHRGDMGITILRNNRNEGYGGNQKVGYQNVIGQSYDIVAMLHADGQYAPEVLAALLNPLVEGKSDMVFGSRMAEGCQPLRGGMPLHKYLGNLVLTYLENRLAGMNLSEFHSGYRAYRCAALQRIPLSLNSDSWHFDTEILLEFHAAGMRITEVPIPTYYGDEICHVKGIPYAIHCLLAAVSYRLTRWGLWQDVKYQPEIWRRFPYQVKTQDPYSSQRIALECAARHPQKQSLLEIGPGSGAMTEQFQQMGYRVTVVESNPLFAEMARKHATLVICQDVETIQWDELSNYDVVVLADILEHLRDPLYTLEKCVDHLNPEGGILITLPNAAHWSVRLELLWGRFQYRPRGILDQSHLRFFTRNSAKSMIKRAGLRVREDWAIPIPLPLLIPAAEENGPLVYFHILNHVLTQAWKSLLAYQWGFWCEAEAGARIGGFNQSGPTVNHPTIPFSFNRTL
jgi:glycosyltransferase involved in cell wall biosynthesis